MSHDRASDSGTNTVLIVLGVVAAVILLIVLACGALSFLAFRGVSGVMATVKQFAEDMQQADVAAAGFLNDLAANHADQAYERTSKAFQQRQTLQEFQAYVDKNPPLKNGAGNGVQGMAQTVPGRYTLTYRLDNTGANTCTLQLVKEDDQWRVDMVTVP
jgi:hypothetical protein